MPIPACWLGWAQATHFLPFMYLHRRLEESLWRVICVWHIQSLLASSTSRRAAKKKKKKAEKATAEAAVEDMDDMAADAEP